MVDRRGAIIAIPLTPRNLGAALGILAALFTVGYIGFRLHEATAPVATSLVLSSVSPVPISFQSLRINDEEVLPKGWTPSEPRTSQAGPEQPQGNVALQVGRPAKVKATLSLPQGATAYCDLEPRPYGACAIKVKFSTSSDMQCEYECKSEALKP
jgi:hypothetical protein